MSALVLWGILLLVYNFIYWDNLNAAYRRGREARLDASFKVPWYLALQVLIHLAAYGSFLWPEVWPLKIKSPSQSAALMTAALGLVLIIVAKRTLSRNYSPCQDSYYPESLTCVGPYRYIRHPLYTGNLLYFLGLTVASASGVTVVLFVLLASFFLRSARKEEIALSASLPGYVEYMGRSKKFLPWIY
jgi:protein-S-isoprenylcysteine O-methyltransferase